jgi:protein-disulfide isomerase
MASRKEQKEQARARRLAEEQEAAARAHRNRRLQMLGGVLVGAAIVIGVAIAISSGNSTPNTNPDPNHNQQAQIGHTVATLLDGIPQNGTTLGKPSAPVTMTYFGDLECPICRDFTLQGGFSQLVQNEVRQGKVKVVYRSFCTATCNGPGQQVFNTQQVAAYAAGEQQRFWNYAELFYREQGAEGSNYVNEAYLKGLAQQTPGLDISKWQTDRQNPAMLGQVQADGAAGTAAGVNGTPTLVMKGPKGEQAVPASIPDYSQLQQTISQVS